MNSPQFCNNTEFGAPGRALLYLVFDLHFVHPKLQFPAASFHPISVIQPFGFLSVSVATLLLQLFCSRRIFFHR